MAPLRPASERDYETGLLLIVAIVVAAAGAFTYAGIVADRETTLQTSARLSDSLAESIEGHFEAALRDAANAGLSAAMLIENAGGSAKFRGERHLHDELKRELWDERSTARLILADSAGRVLASSAEYPAPTVTLPPYTAVSRSTPPGGRVFRIGQTQRSPIGGELVIPYECDLFDAAGAVAGVIRAELRVDHFAEMNSTITRRDRSQVIIGTNSGILMISVPVIEDALGKPAPGLTRFLALQQPGRTGDIELTSQRDGVARYYSWRRMKQHPMIVAVGLGKEDVLAPWVLRAWQRATVVAAACLVLIALTLALIVYQRRLAASRDQLRESQLRYATAMEHSTIGILVATIDGRWQHANPALCSMLGYTLDELLALPSEALTAAEFRAVRTEQLTAFMRGSVTSHEREKRVVRKDASEIWVHMQTTLMRNAAGEPAGLIAHVTDITQRKEADRAIRKLNEDLEHRVAQRTADLSRANQDLEAFSYSAAHDLRGPLERLVGFVDVLAHELGELPEKAARRLESIRRQSRQMTALITDLLALSQTSRTQLRQVPVDMQDLVEEAREELEMAAQGRNVQWIVAPLPEVHADRGLVREALVNLLGNALKYSRGRDPAIIEVGTMASDSPAEALFFVRDNGAGFDMAYASELFVAFRRLHSTSEFEGSGIGLAIVQRIIERNGGRIWAHAEVGKGATFTFTLRRQVPG